MIISSKMKNRPIDKIIGSIYIGVGLSIYYATFSLSNPWSSYINSQVEYFIRFIMFNVGIVTSSAGFIKFMPIFSETMLSPGRAIAILEHLNHESTTLDLEGNDKLLRMWTHKLLITVDAMFGSANNITKEFKKDRDSYWKNKKRGRPVDPKENIAKNLELLEAALSRARWEQADVMRPVKE